MNNRDWLYTLQPRGLARWFEAEHVEPNDDFEPKDGVSEGKADANDAKKVSTTSLNVPNVIKWQYMDGSECVQEFAQDSREKLLYDASELVADCAPSGSDCDPMYRAIVELLDRQAAITERECMERAISERVGWDCAECAEGLGKELDARCDPLKERIAELQAKVDELNKKWANANMRCAEANAEAERWQQKCNELESRHCPHYHAHEHRCDVHETRIAELTAKVDGLTAERDMWRDKCGRMLDAAHEIERIAEVDE